MRTLGCADDLTQEGPAVDTRQLLQIVHTENTQLQTTKISLIEIT